MKIKESKIITPIFSSWVVINLVDHLHGGGEGRAPIEKKNPTTPWDYIALERLSRVRNKYNNNLFFCHSK